MKPKRGPRPSFFCVIYVDVDAYVYAYNERTFQEATMATLSFIQWVAVHGANQMEGFPLNA